VGAAYGCAAGSADADDVHGAFREGGYAGGREGETDDSGPGHLIGVGERSPGDTYGGGEECGEQQVHAPSGAVVVTECCEEEAATGWYGSRARETRIL
jgi:hypothetical protein